MFKKKHDFFPLLLMCFKLVSLLFMGSCIFNSDDFIDPKIGDRNIGAPSTSLPPVFNNINPSTGSTTGGTLISLSGSNFVNGINVFVGGSSCSGVVIVSDTLITCRTPARSPGLVDVEIRLGLISKVLIASFDYKAERYPAHLSPVHGISVGGAIQEFNSSGFLSPVDYQEIIKD